MVSKFKTYVFSILNVSYIGDHEVQPRHVWPLHFPLGTVRKNRASSPAIGRQGMAEYTRCIYIPNFIC